MKLLGDAPFACRGTGISPPASSFLPSVCIVWGGMGTLAHTPYVRFIVTKTTQPVQGARLSIITSPLQRQIFGSYAGSLHSRVLASMQPASDLWEFRSFHAYPGLCNLGFPVKRVDQIGGLVNGPLCSVRWVGRNIVAYVVYYSQQQGTAWPGRHCVAALKFVFKEKNDSADLIILKGVRCFNF